MKAKQRRLVFKFLVLMTAFAGFNTEKLKALSGCLTENAGTEGEPAKPGSVGSCLLRLL